MIVCIGEAVIDMFQKKVPGLGDVFMPLPGGCSYNTSIAIGALGVPAAFVGRLSRNFFGDIQVKRLREYNVRDDLLIRCAENPILAFIKTEEGGQPQYAFYDEGTADKLLSTGELPKLPGETSCIVFGSISMNMEPIATTVETLILNEASKNANERKVIAFDPNIRPFMIKDKNEYIKRFSRLAGTCTIAKISSEDFEYIYPDTEPEAALKKIIDLGARLAIVTLGAGGAIALLKRSDGSMIKVRITGIHIRQIADTVGAGDPFLGAFLARLHYMNKLSHNAIIDLNETDLGDALSFANKAASIVCTRYGANPPSMEEIASIS
ncbi:MAG: carbohydrate kinase [Treponema sp.]|jgi:fructokinase|nr:carbohydrate kinase [Treponema sp.]